MVLFVAILLVFLGDMANGFTCPETGVFANTDSNDCKTFVTCDHVLNPEVHNCIGNSYFWPEKKGCFSQYNCAMGIPTDYTNPCEGYSYTHYLTLPDKNSADCTKYIACLESTVYTSGGIFEIKHVISEQCPSGTAYRPDGRDCESDHQCVNYQCITQGIFENPNDCSTFIQCWKYDRYASTGGEVSSLFPDLNHCPPNTKFNPYSKKCDSFYNCDGIDPHGGVDPCLNYYAENPFVPNPYDSIASSYVACQHHFPGFAGTKDVILKTESPADTFFSPLLGKCYENYDPNKTCSKDPCSSGPGKYINYESGNCRSYIECQDEATTREVYEPTYEIRYCPPGAQYSPETYKCKRQYVCPSYPINYCYPQIPTTTTTKMPTTTVVG